MSESDYSYEIIRTDEDARICAQMIAEEFSAHNPITRFDRVTSEQFFREVSWPLAREMFDEHLSFLVRYRVSGEIIAALIAGDLYRYHQNHPFDPSSPPQNIAVSDLLDEMDHQFIDQDFGQPLKPNMVLHMTVGAVRTDHCGNQVATRLSQIICDYARKQYGFQYVLVQVTNPITRHIYVNKLAGKEVTMVDPTQWQWQKKDHGLSLPYKNYQHGSIPNILITLTSPKD